MRHQGLLVFLELFCKEMLRTVVAPAGGGTLQAGLTLESRGCLQDCFLRTRVRVVVVVESGRLSVADAFQGREQVMG